jgi:hypothetical protein
MGECFVMLPKEEAEERLEVRMSGSFPGFVFLCRLAHNPLLRGGEPACSGSSSRRLAACVHDELCGAAAAAQARVEEVDERQQAAEAEIGVIKDAMAGLKVELYGRFGKSINLDD